MVLNRTLILAGLLVWAFLFFAAPWLGVAAAWVILGAALTAPLRWGLMHESIHGHLFDTARWNRLGGRLMGYGFVFSWDGMRFGHLTHHRYNRHALDRPEELRPGQSWGAAAPAFYAKLLGGHAAMSVLVGVALGGPWPLVQRILAHTLAGPELTLQREGALRYFGDPDRRGRMRTDLAIDLALLAGMLWCWHARPFVPVAALAAQWLVLSLLDDAPHHGTARAAAPRPATCISPVRCAGCC